MSGVFNHVKHKPACTTKGKLTWSEIYDLVSRVLDFIYVANPGNISKTCPCNIRQYLTAVNNNVYPGKPKFTI